MNINKNKLLLQFTFTKLKLDSLTIKNWKYWQRTCTPHKQSKQIFNYIYNTVQIVLYFKLLKL